ncbi:T9SS type A sorting domain-containing protein [Dyadobacter sandarakinus]|uniref:T9SS type A sorting domain-containing protein n=1 Tax=Dyadobacter sandarakinus TaxID=2747268 RepID=A0ABX7I763_9BACT|nr:T9SS type A sorting domain-containing protein [Dyadobacter sandarakinus]QRR00816.1 T9SS type A sorting domain-containing protein [Dyadobacter sandarakinus]
MRNFSLTNRKLTLPRFDPLFAYLVSMGLMLLGVSTANATIRIVTPTTYISTINNTALPDDIILFTSGIYSGGITITKAGLKLRAQTPGTVIFRGVDTRIIIGARKVTVDGFVFDNITNPERTQDEIRYVIYLRAPAAGADSIRITNCAFISCGSDNIEETNAGNIRIDNRDGGGEITDATIDHCYFYNSRVCGIKFGAGVPKRITIERNYFHHFNWSNSDGLKDNGNEPIALGSGNASGSSSNSIIQYNYFEDVLTAAGGEQEIISVKSSGNTIQYNTIRNSTVYGNITLRYADSVTVKGNALFGAGLRMFGAYHKVINNYIDGTNATCLKGISASEAGTTEYAPLTNGSFIHNTFVNNRIALNFGQTGGQNSSFITNNEFRHNLFYSTVPGSAVTNVRAKATANNTWVKNLAWATGGTGGTPGAYYDAMVAGCTTATPDSIIGDGPTSSTTRFVKADPSLLLNQTTKMFRLQSSSANARDKVPLLANVTDDIDGQTRGQTTDYGADEYSTTSVLRSAYTKESIGTEVGPDWFIKIGLEAEDGLATTTSFSVVDDPQIGASGDKYIWKSSGSRNDTPRADASYSFFTLADTGEYAIWVRRKYPSSAGDSYFSRVENGVWNIETSSGTLNTAWVWDKIDTKTFTRGVHTLDLGYRESLTKIDRILITSTVDEPNGEAGRMSAFVEEFIDDTSLQSSVLYPIPAEQYVNLRLHSASRQTLNYTLINLQSQPVESGSKPLQQGLNQVQIALPKLSKGVYLLQIQLDDQLVTKKLLVK